MRHSSGTVPVGRGRDRLRDLRRRGRPAAAARHGPGDADARLARGPVPRARRRAGSSSSASTTATSACRRTCTTPRRRTSWRRSAATRRRRRTRSRTAPTTPSACSTGSGITGPVHVVGASMGGMIAQTRRDPAPRPRRLADVDHVDAEPARSAPPTQAAAAVLFAPPATNRERGGAARARRPTGSSARPATRSTSSGWPSIAGEAYDRAYDPLGVARQLLAIHASGDRTPALRQLDVPTLVVHGEDDPLVQVDGGRATAAAVPGAELLVVARAWATTCRASCGRSSSTRSRALADRAEGRAAA